MPQGIQLFDKDGNLYFETGAHVIDTINGFSAKIGQIAATWAAAEAHLGCYYGALLGTTPAEALKTIGKMSAAGLTCKAKAVAKGKLPEKEFAELVVILEALDAVRLRRNRTQHDLWSRRTGEDQTLHAVHVDDYRNVFLSGAQIKTASDIDDHILLVERYAANADNAFTLENLESLRKEIERVSEHLLRIFLAISSTN